MRAHNFKSKCYFDTNMEQDNWLEIFANDHKGTNFRSYVTSIDVGRVEYWTANIHWDKEEQQIILFTQYEPKLFCMEENCVHWPRSHWEDIVLDYQGNNVWTQVEAI